MPSVRNVDSGTFTQKAVLSQYIELNQRNLDEHVHGTLTVVVTGEALSSVAPIADTNGISKLLFVINAGGDFDGSLKVTGTKVDRNTATETASFEEDIIVDALTTDDSDTDAEGNTRHAFTGAYVTDEWFRGSFTVTTTDLTLTDVDIWAIAFEQASDTPVFSIKAFDMTFDVLNTLAWLYVYIYTIVVTAATKKCAIARSVSATLPVGESEVKTYRRKLDNLALALDGTKDGFWMEMHFGPSPQRYFADITFKIWLTLTMSIG